MSKYKQWLAAHAGDCDVQGEASTDFGITDSKMREILALLQIMFYDIHRGRKRTPLHIMNSQVIDEVCKSATLQSGFNHFGLCLSPDELHRFYNDMCMYMVTQGDEVPFPSHFDPGVFTTAAFDNFNHLLAILSGMEVSNDTVSVLYQDDIKAVVGKPGISDTCYSWGEKSKIIPALSKARRIQQTSSTSKSFC